MNYQRISPFPDSTLFENPELRALAQVWRERKSALETTGAYQTFVKKLQREWAIETGIIERLYHWDRGVTDILIEQGIESSLISHQGRISQQSAKQIHALIQDHLNIVEALFGYVKGEVLLSEHFIRGLHAEFTAHQDYTEALTTSGDFIQVPLRKGEYKQQPNNPRRPDGVIHEYCPPYLTQEEMGSLVRRYQAAESSYAPEVKAAWLHHRFTQIHPFQDGNGRVARALATLAFLREGLFPLVIRESDRETYIGALESADRGELRPLVALFAARQREAILKALGLEQQSQQGQQKDEIIRSTLEWLKNKQVEKQQAASRVYEYADKLFKVVSHKLEQLAEDLKSQLLTIHPQYSARHDFGDNASENRHYFQKQILEIAGQQGYFANLESYRSWSRMAISTEHQFDYVISFHGYARGETGVLAVSAFTYLKIEQEGGREWAALQPAAMDIFQFNYAETYESTAERFENWLEDSIAIALAEWRKSLQG